MKDINIEIEFLLPHGGHGGYNTQEPAVLELCIHLPLLLSGLSALGNTRLDLM